MLVSIIVPVYNEAEGLAAFVSRLRPTLQTIGEDHEIIFVNDGSTDESEGLLAAMGASDRRLKVLDLSRNFGHQVAITAGLDHADGDAVLVLDADLQDPPELLPEMLHLLQSGYDVVSAQRQSRPGDSVWKRSTASLFYWFMRRFVDRRLVPEVGDFRLFSRRAVLAIRQFREQHRFMRGLVAWLGLKEVIIPFQREERAHGTTKYPLLKMLQLAWTAVSSFSAIPLRVSTNLGFLVMLFGIAYLLYSVSAALIAKTTIQGWTSLVCLQIIFSGAILMAVGVLGNYVARIYEESKQRPLYVVSRSTNFPHWGDRPERAIVFQASESAVETPTPALATWR
jgi:glycosyltransferase involved in cell wall biosynthesis